MEEFLGSINIFFFDETDLIIVANSESKKYGGTLTQVNSWITLTIPYTNEELEDSVKKVLGLYNVYEIDELDPLSPVEKALGLKRNQIHKIQNIKAVVLMLYKGAGYNIFPSKRKKREFEPITPRIQIPLDYTANGLANGIKKAIELSS